MNHKEFTTLIEQINKTYNVDYLATQMKQREFVMPISLFVPLSIEGINIVDEYATKHTK